MFIKKQRVSRALFSSLFGKSPTIREKSVSIQHVDIDIDYAKFAVVAPKRIFLKSVERSQARRKGYSCIKEAISSRKRLIGVFFFVLNKNFLLNSEDVCVAEINRLLDKTTQRNYNT